MFVKYLENFDDLTDTTDSKPVGTSSGIGASYGIKRKIKFKHVKGSNQIK
jgi:hypothetical protein